MKFLRIALAIVFVWFGALKIFGVSPAYGLIEQTVTWWDAAVFVPVLGVWEVLIGLFFLFEKTTKLAVILWVPQMAGTFLPVLVAPEAVFTQFPFALTLEGQYIVKNVVIIAGAVMIARTQDWSEILKMKK